MEVISCYYWRFFNLLNFSVFTGSCTFSSIPRHGLSKLQSKTLPPPTPPPHSPFCTYTHTHTYVVWGTNSLLTASSLLSPHSLAFISPLCTSMFFQTISPDLLSLLTSQQMGNEQKKLCKN